MTTNQPIPLETLRKAVQRAKELEGKATKGPWAWSPFAEKSSSYAIGVAVKVDGAPVSGRFEHGHWDDDSGEFVEDILCKEEIGSIEAATVNYSDPEVICLSRSLLPAVLELLEWQIPAHETFKMTQITQVYATYPLAAALVRWYESEGREVSRK